MNDYETWDILGCCVEYYDEIHAYIVDGELLPSITTILKTKYKNKYSRVNKNVLERAAKLGTEMHTAIQEYEERGKESDIPELRGYKFLKKHYKWECIENEKPVILFRNEKPIACGRIDMIAKIGEELGCFDFKRTATLDKEYLAYQLNLYRIAYQQCYGKHIQFLRGLHLREDVRKFVNIPINEQMAWELVNEYLEGKI